MDELIRLLHEGGYSCVIRKEEIRTFTQRGVADLYDLLNQHPVFLHGQLYINLHQLCKNTALYLHLV